jgi:hypothetical protein
MATLLEILSHAKTRDLMGRISRGDDPRYALAHVAGMGLAEQLAKAMGLPIPVVPATGAGHKAPRPAHAEDPNVVDAEFRVINVTEQAKKAGKK